MDKSSSLAALAALKRAGCRQIVFKYCSTFDSTPTGNIGPVAEALARTLDARAVVMCPAFPANGRTVYQGTLFVGDRPLAEQMLSKRRRATRHQRLQALKTRELLDHVE